MQDKKTEDTNKRLDRIEGFVQTIAVAVESSAEMTDKRYTEMLDAFNNHVGSFDKLQESFNNHVGSFDKLQESFNNHVGAFHKLQEDMQTNFTTMHKGIIGMNGAVRTLERDSAFTDKRFADTNKSVDNIKWFTLAGLGIIAVVLSLKPIQDFFFY